MGYFEKYNTLKNISSHVSAFSSYKFRLLAVHIDYGNRVESADEVFIRILIRIWIDAAEPHESLL